MKYLMIYIIVSLSLSLSSSLSLSLSLSSIMSDRGVQYQSEAIEAKKKENKRQPVGKEEKRRRGYQFVIPKQNSP